MKKLRILFLAVLAMALMASGAFATAGVTAITIGSETTATLTLATGATTGNTVEVTIATGGTAVPTVTAEVANGATATGVAPTVTQSTAEATATSHTAIITIAPGTVVGTATVEVTAKEGNDDTNDKKVTITVTVVAPSTKITLSCEDKNATFTKATDSAGATLTIPAGVTATVKATLDGTEESVHVESKADVATVVEDTPTEDKVADVKITGAKAGTTTVTITADPADETKEACGASYEAKSATLTVTVVELPAASALEAELGGFTNGVADATVTLTLSGTSTIAALPVAVALNENTDDDGNALFKVYKADGATPIEGSVTLTQESDTTYTGSFKVVWTSDTKSTAIADAITLSYSYTDGEETAKEEAKLSIPKDVEKGKAAAATNPLVAAGTKTTTASDKLTLDKKDFTDGVANITLTLTMEDAVTANTTLPLTLSSLPENVTAKVGGTAVEEGGSFDVTAAAAGEKLTGTLVLTVTEDTTEAVKVVVAYVTEAPVPVTATITVPKGVTAAEGTSDTTVSPDIDEITFKPESASVAVGATKTVTATITISGDKNSTVPTVTVKSANEKVATVVKSGDVVSADSGMTFTVTVVVTGVKSSDSTVKVGLTAVLGKNSKTESFDVTVTAASDEEEGGDATTVTSPDIDWYEAYSFNNKTWTLKYSADEAGVTQTAAVVVSSDFTATPKLVISPDANDYVEFTVGTATKASSSDTRGTVYTFAVTATPLSVDAKGSSFTAYATVTSGSVYKTDSLTFTVIVSDDTKSSDSGDDSGSDTVVTSWDLTVTADKTEATLNYYEKTTVVITSRPADEGVDFVITNNASSTADYKLESKDEFSSTAYVVTYTFTAGETEGEYPITFTVKATSGDDTPQTETVTVTFTVAYDETKQVAPEAPADLAETLGGTDQAVGGHTFHIDTVAERADKFKAGKGVVGWGVKAPFKVRKVFGEKGWWFRFLNAVAQAYFDLNAPTVYGASTASIAADVASSDSALSVGFEDDYTAFFELDLEKAAKTLPEGATYQANSSYTSDATADDGGKPSDPMTAGELKGAKSSSGGGEQGGGDQGGGDEEGEEEGDAVNFLGGSSGGCDAGFGALALALAASMIFVRKRS